jgi:hypothetical protein
LIILLDSKWDCGRKISIGLKTWTAVANVPRREGRGNVARRLTGTFAAAAEEWY